MDEKITDGGAAYPHPSFKATGLSKREYFAAMIMQGLATRYGLTDLPRIVDRCFEAADAMVEYSENTKQHD